MAETTFFDSSANSVKAEQALALTGHELLEAIKTKPVKGHE